MDQLNAIVAGAAAAVKAAADNQAKINDLKSQLAAATDLEASLTQDAATQRSAAHAALDQMLDGTLPN
jgi:hypothetical protein